MNTTEKYTERHSYQISKISDDQKSDILFFRSSINMVKYLTNINKTKQTKNNDEDRTPNILTQDV
jgi:hypothetical protein